MIRIDAHQHYWKPSRGDYGWLTPSLAKLYRDFLPSDLRPHLLERSIEKTILVQAAPTVEETQFLLELADSDDSIAGVVGWAPLDQAIGPGIVRRLARHEKLFGLRPMVQDIKDDAWLLSPRIEPSIWAMIETGLAFDALVMPRHLDYLTRFVDRYDRLRVVIDHGAKPLIPARGKMWPGEARWRRSMAELAKRPQVFCKISGLMTEAATPHDQESLRPFIDHILECFGPRRTMWGSDWPVLLLAGEYGEWVDTVVDLCGRLSKDECAAVFGQSAADFYRRRTAGDAPREDS